MVGRKFLTQFFAIDFRALAFFRVGLGLLLLCDLFNRASQLTFFYTDQGVLPRTLLIECFDRPFHFSLHLINGSTEFQALLFLISAVFALALLIGYRTFFSTLASWVFLISLHSRTPCVLQGGDVILRLYLFWSLFLPLGTRFSYDSRGKSQAPSAHVLSMASLAILLQICFVYWFTSAFKTHPQWRVSGEAVYYTLSIDQFSTPLGIALLSHPSMMKALSFMTLYWEQFGTYLAFVPFASAWFRCLTVALFLTLHLGFLLCMELGLFPYISMLGWVLFLPTEFWDALEKRISASKILLKKIPFSPCLLEPRVLEKDKKEDRSAETKLEINRLKNRINRQPSWVSRMKNGAIQSLAFFFLVYIYLWNLRSLDFKHFESYFPTSWNSLGYFFRLEQKWSMFASRPSDEDGWFVIPAKLKDGTIVDLFRNGSPVHFKKPPLVSAEFSNQRIRKFYMNLTDPEFKPCRRTLARTLCREWNAVHPKNKKIKWLKIYYLREMTMPFGTPPRLKKIKLMTHWHDK